VIPGIERCDRAGYEKREVKDERYVPGGRQEGKKDGENEGREGGRREGQRKEGRPRKEMKEGKREERNKLTLKLSTPLGGVALSRRV
jgi:hypothetical protein